MTSASAASSPSDDAPITIALLLSGVLMPLSVVVFGLALWSRRNPRAAFGVACGLQILVVFVSIATLGLTGLISLIPMFAMAPGVLIDYRMRVFGLPFKWRTRITSWNPPHEFVDEQMSGPYKEWVHTHTFKEISGGTSISDVVKYRLPLWPFGEIAYPIVRRQLDQVFRFRQQSIAQLFVGEASGGAFPGKDQLDLRRGQRP